MHGIYLHVPGLSPKLFHFPSQIILCGENSHPTLQTRNLKLRALRDLPVVTLCIARQGSAPRNPSSHQQPCQPVA